MYRIRIGLLGLAVAFALLPLDSVFAQRRSRGGGSLTDQLYRQSVQEEITLTEDQKEDLRPLLTKLAGDKSKVSEVQRDLYRAEGKEREKLTEEYQKLSKDYNAKVEKELQTVLSDDQLTRLKQLYYQDRGVVALISAEVSESLELSSKQTEELKELVTQRSDAIRKLGFRAPREEREGVENSYNEKIMDVLSTSQQTKWQAMLGPKSGDEEVTDADESSSEEGEKTADASSEESEEEPEDEPEEKKKYVPEINGPVVASFNAFAQETEGEDANEITPEPETKPAPPANENPVPTPITKEKPTLSFNFSNADWIEVLKLFAEANGYTLDPVSIPEDKFNYFDKGRYTATEALDIINGYLIQRDHLLIRRDQFLVCLSLDDDIPANIIPTVAVSEIDLRGKNELFRVTFPIDAETDLDTVVEEVEELLGPQGFVSPLTAAQSIIVTEMGSKHRIIRDLLVGVTAGPEALTFKAYPVKHITAYECEMHVRRMFGIQEGVTNVSSGSGGNGRSSSSSSDPRRAMMEMYMRSRGGGDRGGSSSSSSSSSKSKNKNMDLFMAADARSNLLLVTTSNSRQKLIAQIVEALDTPETAENKNFYGNQDDFTPVLRVYKVHKVEAREVAKSVEALMPGVVVNEDSRHRTLHVKATPLQHKEVEEWIRQMDGVGGTTVQVIPLNGFSAATAIDMLSQLFFNEDDPPSVQSDLYGRNLIVRGDAEHIRQMQTVLAQYTAPNPRNSYGSRGRVRQIQLNGQNPEQFARLLEQLWSASNPNPVRVVIPQPPKAPEEKVPAETGINTELPLKKTPQRNDEINTPKKPVTKVKRHPLEEISYLQGEASEETLANQPDQNEPPLNNPPELQDNKPAITISLINGQLVISSPDEDALDRMEDLIQLLSQQMQPKTQWTVFYLRASTAADTASMLQTFFPNATTSTLTTTSALPTPSALQLRIIPEPRTNSLFVSGPPQQIREIEDMLKLLDATELPSQVNDRLPRYLDIKHADVFEVSAIVEEVFAEEMGKIRNSSQQRSSRGSTGQPQAPPQPRIQLTIGVDTRTNQLIVSATEPVYQKVKAMVETLDNAAKEANRTVQVVPLINANSATVQKTLTSMFPKVTVSTSGGQPRTRQSSTPRQESSRGDDRGGDRGSSSSDEERRERIRAFFESRMREGGGDRGSSSGRPSFGGDRGGRPSFGGDRGSSGRGRGR